MSEIPFVQSEEINIAPDFIDCLDRAFLKFGTSVFSVVYWKFHFNTKLSKEEIAERPDLFTDTIREIFRDGTPVIERAIIDEVKFVFNLPDRNYKDLEDVVDSIKLRGMPGKTPV